MGEAKDLAGRWLFERINIYLLLNISHNSIVEVGGDFGG